MTKLHVKKDDTVVVITGKDKGKSGKVMEAYPAKGKVLVGGVNVVTKHKKAQGQPDPGGIIHQENVIDASNVMLQCPKCNKATRTGKKVLDDGKKVRFCKKCGEILDK